MPEFNPYSAPATEDGPSTTDRTCPACHVGFSRWVLVGWNVGMVNSPWRCTACGRLLRIDRTRNYLVTFAMIGGLFVAIVAAVLIEHFTDRIVLALPLLLPLAGYFVWLWSHERVTLVGPLVKD